MPKDRKKTLACHAGLIPTVKVQEDIQCIGDRAFLGCVEVTSVILPEGLLEIGEYAFLGCTNLKSIRIPKSVKKIGDYALGYFVKSNTIKSRKRTKIKNFSIIGAKNSEAERYANKNKIKFIIEE